MANEKKELKVTDKRIFTAEGDIREEFRSEIHPSDPAAAPPRAPEPAPKRKRNRNRSAADRSRRKSRRSRKSAAIGRRPRRQSRDPLRELRRAAIAQAYMCLGMLRNPYQPQAKLDPGAARQMIDILTMLQEKTAGNLTPEEEDFLTTHLGELKLAYVQRTKSI